MLLWFKYIVGLLISGIGAVVKVVDFHLSGWVSISGKPAVFS